MQLILYPLLVFMITFLIQLFFILYNKKRKNEEIYININKESRENIKFAIKMIVALIISVIIGIIFFYVFGILVLVGLNEGR